MNANQLKYQQGATLIVSLVLLLLMTIIGISSSSNISMMERITGNLSDKSATKQLCEAALRQSEAYLSDLDVDEIPIPSTTATSADRVWALNAANGLSKSLSSLWMRTNWPSGALTPLKIPNTTFFTEQEKKVYDTVAPRNDYGTGGRPGTYYYRNSASTISARAASTICQATYAKRFN